MSCSESLSAAAATETCAAAPNGPALELLTGSAPDARHASHYERSQIPIARAGDAIARVLDPAAIRLGPNTELSEDGKQVMALASGQVRWRDGRIWVEDVLVIAGDVDFSTGSIDFAQDVIIHGSVLDLFKVKSGGTIRVCGAIEAAEVHAMADLFVGQAIAGKEKGRCVAGQNLQAKHISNASIEAGGDVTAETEVSHSRIICGGALRVEHGALLASHVTATGGVRCRILGSPAGAETLIEVGIDDGLRRMYAQLASKFEADQKQITKVRQTVEPLMRNQKALTAAQKETATELLFRASELEDENKRVLASLRTRSEEVDSRSKLEIVVDDTLCAGVRIRFPGLEATIPGTMRGPVRIVPGGTSGEPRIVVGSVGRAGSAMPVPTRIITDAAMEKLQRILAEQL